MTIKPDWGPEGYRPCFLADGVTIIYETDETKPILMVWNSQTNSTPKPFLNLARPNLAQTRADVKFSTGYVAFAGINNENHSQIYTANADGGGVELLLPPSEWGMTYPCWLPNGADTIMATQFTDHSLVSISNGNYIPVSPPSVFVGMASPNQNTQNAWVAFAGQQNNNGHYNQDTNQIWVLTTFQTVKLLDQRQGRAPWYSPDGSFIAFESNRSGKGYAIYTILPDGTNLVQGPFTDPSINAQHPKFSHDGKK